MSRGRPSRRFSIRRSGRSQILRIACPILFSLPAAVAGAADRNWIDPGGGDYDDAGNWNPTFPINTVPNATDNVIFDLPNAYIVNFTPLTLNVTNRAAFFRGGSVTFGASPIAAWYLTNGFVVGQSAGQDATLTLLDSMRLRVASSSGTVGDAAGSTGHLTVRGDLAAGALTVGNFGTGYFLVDRSVGDFTSVGTFAAQSGSLAFGTVSGSWNCDDLRIGPRGNATFDITGVIFGGVVRGVFGSVGGTGGTGRVNISGASAYWQLSNTLTVGGSAGVAQVTTSAGGQVLAQNAINISPFGRVDVNANGGVLVGNTLSIQGGLMHMADATGLLVVGRNFSAVGYAPSVFLGADVDGQVNLSSGGRLDLGSVAALGYKPSVTGTVSVDGAGSRLMSPTDMYVGFSGRGNLNLTNGGTVSDRAVAVALNPGSSGFVFVSASAWLNSSILTVGNRGNASMTVTNGATVQNTDASIAPNFGSTGMVTVGGASSGTGAPAQWFNTGSLTVGNPFSGTGTLQIQAGGQVNATDVVVQPTGNVQITGGDLVGRSLQINAGSVSRTSGRLILNAPVDLSGFPAPGLYVATSGTATLSLSSNALLTNTGEAYVGFGPGSGGQVTADGPFATFSNSSFISVGEAGSGRLTVTNGAVVSASSIYVGYTNTANGRIDVGGGNASLSAGSLFTSSFGGTSSVNVGDGGNISISGLASIGRNSQLRVDGGKYRSSSLSLEGGQVVHTAGIFAISSTDAAAGDGLHIGLLSGSGALTVLAGGFLNNTGFARIGSQPGSTGSAVVSGLNSLWFNPGDLEIGSFGNGTLLVSDAAMLSAGAVYLAFGDGTTGSGTVQGNLSTWNATTLNVGYQGAGRLTVTSGATLITTTGLIGVGPSADGRVAVGGANALWTNSGLVDVGGTKGATASLTIQAGGRIFTNSLRIAPAQSVFNFGGTVSTNLLTNAGGFYTQTAGSITTGPVVNDGALSFAGLASTAGISGTGSTTVFDILTADHVRQRSLFAEQLSSRVLIRPNGGPGGASRLENLSLGVDPFTFGPLGRLDIGNNALVLDYTGSDPISTVRGWIMSGRNGGVWDGRGIDSTAAGANPTDFAVGYADAGAVLGMGGGTFVGQPADATSILVRCTLLGDSNLDGTVNFNDLVALAQHYNTFVSFSTSYWWSNGDFTFDGFVDFNDLVGLAQHYNTSLPAEPIPGAPLGFDQDLARAFAAVPEPSAMSFLAACAFAVGRRFRRR